MAATDTAGLRCSSLVTCIVHVIVTGTHTQRKYHSMTNVDRSSQKNLSFSDMRSLLSDAT